ncbi:MAG: M14 family metallopeptidase [Ignavibacteriaceae bacterium]|nr:M14 family metallopeptidase [Ignavibacteriaceae bacterium]HRP91789.1 M14 family metallopeptidase [Ignavibacteriaceae bacterium]HRQ54401.1 M14 family metallopeptidase [Ignavibacteriaceae bacterium]
MKNKNISKDWLTFFEKSNQLESPDYENTLKYFQKFTDSTPFVKIKPIGLTPQGRELKVIIVSKDKAFTPEQAKKTGKAILLIQNGIHPGEVEGKDACMLLLREILITKEKEHFLNNTILLIIPILNVDGHERISPFNRPNQSGPKKMGWRTNALNLNLNRDYLKADSTEIKSFLKLFNDWLPDFMIDNHTTNGADYQYHVTYGIETHQNIDRGLIGLIEKKYLPHLLQKVEDDGFIIGPYMEFKSGTIESGIVDLPAPPRLSHGYCATQNRICLLVETHSLKPFANRVFSTKSMMEQTISFVNDNHKEIVTLNGMADKQTIKNYLVDNKKFPLVLTGNGKFDKFLFKGFEWYDEYSEITGSTVRKYTNNPMEIEIPIFNKANSLKKITVPAAYLIPPQFSQVIEIINTHQIKVNLVKAKRILKVQRYKFEKVQFASRPYEGRQLPSFTCSAFNETAEIEAGSLIVYTNQRALRVIVNLLEPEAPDSFVNWGFFNAFFERKEYAEAYVMEPYAKQMIKDDSLLRTEFYKKLNEDESFKNNSGKRLDFFYKRSPFYDKEENVYPILRLMGKKV